MSEQLLRIEPPDTLAKLFADLPWPASVPAPGYLAVEAWEHGRFTVCLAPEEHAEATRVSVVYDPFQMVTALAQAAQYWVERHDPTLDPAIGRWLLLQHADLKVLARVCLDINITLARHADEIPRRTH